MTDTQRVFSGSPFEPIIGFCRAIRVGDRVIVSGTAPISADGSVAPDAGAQTTRCLEIIAAALTEAGSSIEQVVRTRMFLTDPADADAVGQAHGAVFAAHPPASTMVVAAALLNPAWKIEIEAEAIIR